MDMKLADFGILCIANKETNRVLCHFVCDSKEERKSNVLIANDIVKYLNEREQANALPLTEQLQQADVSNSVCSECGSPLKYDWIMQYNVCEKCGCDKAN